MIKTPIIQSTLKGFGATASEPEPRLTTSLRVAADRFLKMVLELLDRTECPGHEKLSAHLDRCRQAIVGGDDADAIERSTEECLAACQEIFSAVAERHAQRQGAAIITVVRETITAVSDDMTSLHNGVNGSLDRLDSIIAIPQVAELRTRLTAEMNELKTFASEHYQRSRSTIDALSERIATLEHELASTKRAATLDALTGVANRGAFDAACREWLASGVLRFTLVLVDVDNLKHINDSQGHTTGDCVLRTVAEALKTKVRSRQDLVARFGGDEFAVLAHDLDLRQADARFSGLATTLARSCESASAGALPPVTVSCGIAEYSAGDTVKSLVQRADEALYDAKRRGKNRVVLKSKPLLRDL